MNQHLLNLLALTSLISINGYAESQDNHSCGNAPSPARLAIRHLEPNGIGYHLGYSTLEAFFSPYQPLKDQWLPFVDLRGHVFNDGRLAANAGIGLRYLTSHRVFGINTYYDYRNTRHHSYYQGALGFEVLGKRWDFRWNGYLPFGQKLSSHYDLEFDHFANHYLIQSRKREFALAGMNAEAGVHFMPYKHIPFYLAAGPYYLTGKKTTWGGEVRLAIDCGDYVRLEGATSYDHLFKWMGQGQLSLILPLGRKREVQSSSCSRTRTINERAIQRIDRHEIIPLDQKDSKELARDPTTGLPYFFLFVDNTSHSAGTFESPYTTLLDAQNASNPGNVIYVFPGDGTTMGMDAGFTMQDFQHLWGSGTVQTLATNWGTVTISALTSTMPLITNNSNSIDQIVMLGNNCEVSGAHLTTPITVPSDNLYGIYGEAITNALIQNNQIDFAINTPFSGNVAGIYVDGSGGTVNVSNNIVNINQTSIGSSSNIYGFYTYLTLPAINDQIIYNQNEMIMSNSGTTNAGVYGFFNADSGSLNAQVIVNQNKVTVSNSDSGKISQLDCFESLATIAMLRSQKIYNRNETIVSNSGTIGSVYGIYNIENSPKTDLIVNQNKINITNLDSGEMDSLEGFNIQPFANGLFNLLVNQNEITMTNYNNSFGTWSPVGMYIAGNSSIINSSQITKNNINISNYGSSVGTQGIVFQNNPTINNSSFIRNNINISNTGTSGLINGAVILPDGIDLNVQLIQNELTIANTGTLTGNPINGFFMSYNINNGQGQALYNWNQAIIEPGNATPVTGFFINPSGTGTFILDITNNFSNPYPIQLQNGNPGILNFIIDKNYGNQPTPTGP